MFCFKMLIILPLAASLCAVAFSQKASGVKKLGISHFRPRILENDNDFSGFANSFEEYDAVQRKVKLSVCDNIVSHSGQAAYIWSFEDRLGTLLATKARDERKKNVTVYTNPAAIPRPKTVKTYDCELEWRAPREGSYVARVNMQANGKIIARGQKVINVRDIWIVALGDSYMSGQGNPDQEAELIILSQTKWIHEDCYRSSIAFPYLVYREIAEKYKDRGIIFTFLACSGASIQDGYFTSHIGERPQLDVVKSIVKQIPKTCECSVCCKSHPDLLLMTGGANDLEFESIASGLLVGNNNQAMVDLPKNMKELGRRMDRLATFYRTQLRIPSYNVFYVEYFDPLRNDNGYLDSSCSGLGLTTNADFVVLDQQFRKPINNLIKKKSKTYRWNLVDGVDEAFKYHGVCSSSSYIRTILESVTKQGNAVGAFHPNAAGHEAVAGIVWKRIEDPLKDILHRRDVYIRSTLTKAYNRRVIRRGNGNGSKIKTG